MEEPAICTWIVPSSRTAQHSPGMAAPSSPFTFKMGASASRRAVHAAGEDSAGATGSEPALAGAEQPASRSAAAAASMERRAMLAWIFMGFLSSAISPSIVPDSGGRVRFSAINTP